MFHDNALEATVRDWIRAFEDDRVSAMTQLLNFIMASSGCPQNLDNSAVQDPDSMSDVLHNLQTRFDPVRVFF